MKKQYDWHYQLIGDMESAIAITSIFLGCLLAMLVSITIGVINDCWASFENKENIFEAILNIIGITIAWYFAIDCTFDLIKLMELIS